MFAPVASTPRENAQSPFLTRVALPAVAAVVALGLVLTAVVLLAADQSNRLAGDRQEGVVRTLINQSIADVAHDQEGVTIWDDAVRKLREPDLDLPWIDDNLGVWVQTYYGHEETYILDGADRPIYAMHDKARRDVSAYRQRIGAAAAPLVASLRGQLRGPWIRKIAPPMRSPGAVDLAMVAGSLGRACAAESERPVEAGSLLAGRIGEVAAEVSPDWTLVPSDDPGLIVLGAALLGDDPAAPRPVPQGGVDPRVLRERSRLTARESEVAGLVATGLTNKQIARRLRISEWTVVNHLRQVMRKLDCASRVQVARWVHDLEAGSARLEPADGDGVQQGRVDQRGEVGGDAAGVQHAHQPEVPVDVRRGVDSAGEEFRVLLRHGQGRLVQFGRGGEHAVPDPRDQPPVDVTFAEPR